jgi:fructose/tagatose bisphosphate aldolase
MGTNIDSPLSPWHSHGAYTKHEASWLSTARTDHEDRPNLPLVMHGSSSVPRNSLTVNKYGGNMPNAKGVPEDCIPYGLQLLACKVNIDTDLRPAMTAKIREVFATKPGRIRPRSLGPPRGHHQDACRKPTCSTRWQPMKSPNTGKTRPADAEVLFQAQGGVSASSQINK